MINSETKVPELLPTWLTYATKRLRSITGFVTVYPNGGDSRTIAFSRYDHVVRVASLALSLGEERRLPQSEVLLFAWLHDINRWPFAHNAERDRFDHARDLERFVAGRMSPTTVRQASDIARKYIPDLNHAARAVLLADIVTGFFEDTIFTITGLNLSPSRLPDEALDLLRLPVGDLAFLEELQYLYLLLNQETDVEGYTRNFNSLVFRSTRRFLSDHHFLNTDPLENERFASIRSALRSDYLERQVFPLNNEKVSHGELIRQVFVDPVIGRLGREEAAANFTRWTEIDVVAFVLRERLATTETVRALIPALDYIRDFEPTHCFM
jgi:HD domain-containing protein